jgi:hypothetical protein
MEIFRLFQRRLLEPRALSSGMLGNDHALRKHILKKLYAYGAFAHGHLLVERLRQGIPAHSRGKAKEVLRELVKERLVLEHPTGHGLAYQLNIAYLDRIEEEIFSR